MTALGIDDSMWTEDYEWIVVLGALASIFASFGIGANDVANAFATSVGSKALTMKQAVFLAAIFEFLGAFLLGANVMKTVRKDIADSSCFEDNPALLMHGMLCALFTTGFWLVLASFLKMPVSTTHTIIGAIVGMTMAVQGTTDCVTWYKPKDDWPYVGGVSGIVLSWIVAPFLSYAFAAVLFVTVRYFVLRSQNSYNRAFWFYPIIVWLTCFVLTLFMLYKGAKSQGWVKELGETEAEQDGYVVLIALAISSVIVLITMPFGLPWMDRQITAEWDAKSQIKSGDIESNQSQSNGAAPVTIQMGNIKDANVEAVFCESTEESNDQEELGCIDRFFAGKDAKMDELDYNTQKVHDNAEKFDEKTELFFRYVQIFTTCFNALAHGANDVANAVGPLAAIYIIYKNHRVEEEAELGNDKYWILALGGVGIVFGLGLYGYKIIQVLGGELAKMTPSRGFAVELGAVAVVIMGTRLGIPLSTTHCQVGATCGVAHAEGKNGVNYRSLLVVCAGWILTLLVSGATAALFASLGAYAPSAYGPAYAGMSNPLGELYD